MRTLAAFALLVSWMMFAGCSAGPGAPADGGSASTDAGTNTPDTNVGAEPASPPDAGTDAGSTTSDVGSGGGCPPTGTGMSCAGGGDCPTGLNCDLGRCIPQGRETCGGFAGAPCTMPPYTVCTYEPAHGDVGTCLSAAEHTCACAAPGTIWSCS